MEVRRRRKHTEPYDLVSLASYDKKEFKLLSNPSNSILSRLETGAVTIPENLVKRSRTAVQTAIEAKMAVLIHDQSNAGRYDTGEIIREKENEFSKT